MQSVRAGRRDGVGEIERVLTVVPRMPKMAAQSSASLQRSSNRGRRRSRRGVNLLLTTRYWQLRVWPEHAACSTFTARRTDLMEGEMEGGRGKREFGQQVLT